MSNMDGGSSDWWIYLSVNNHVAPSIAMVPWDTVVVVVVVVIVTVVTEDLQFSVTVLSLTTTTAM